MNDNLTEIRNAIEGIRQVLKEPCAKIGDLPGIISERIKGEGGSGYTTVFLFSGKEDPADPPTDVTLGLNGRLSYTGEDWSQDGFVTTSTYSLKNNLDANGITFATFNPEGIIGEEGGSTPVDLKGKDGRDGKDGQPGTPGSDGKPGEPGKDGKDGSWFEFIYLAMPAPIEIDTPESNNIDGDLPGFDEDTRGTNNPTGVSPSLTIEYTCQREKNRNTNSWGPGSTPAVGAQWGKIGKDGNGIEYIFCLTNDVADVPKTPYSDPDKSESTVDGGQTTVGDYTGHDNPQQTSENMKYCGVSIRKQSYIKDANGIDIQKGGAYSSPAIWASFAKDGKTGGRTVQVFGSADKHNINMPAPIGGGGNPKDNTITPPALPDDFNPEGINFDKKFFTNADETTYQYQYTSYADFDGDGKMTTSGSKPFCITGEDGQPGTDGEGQQFIFRRLANKEQFKLLLDGHQNSGKKLENTTGDVAPTKIDISNTYVKGWQSSSDGLYTIENTDWSDEAEGLDGERYHVEAYCSRTKDPKTKTWSNGSMPMYGSVGGEDGQDGAGVEYIYKVTPDYVNKEGGENPEHSLYVPTRSELKKMIDKESGKNYDELYYQQYQFYFGDPGASLGLDKDWTDEPRDVGPDEPIEGMRQRKKTLNPETKKMEWGDFSEPKIGDRWVHDGYAYLTSYVFTRSAKKPKLPIGGSYSNPIPDKVEGVEVGFDSIPGEKKGFVEDLPVYMSKRTFYSKNWDGDNLSLDEGEKEFDPDWDDPVLMQDTNDFQIEGSADEKCPAIGSFNPYYQKYILREYGSVDQAELEWRKTYPGGSDTATNARGMATSRLKNTVGTDGSITEVKGEKGDAGENGTSVEIEGSAAYLASNTVPKELVTVEKPDGPHTYPYLMFKNSEGIHILYKWVDDQYDDVEKSEIQKGDGYITYSNDVDIDGYLWVGDGDSWEKVGQIQGPAGKTYKLYIRFSDDGGASFTDEDSETPTVPGTTVGKYIGYLVAEESMDASFVNNVKNYKGALGTGDDGGGEEQVFIVSKTESAPEIPTDSAKIVDYCPEIPKLSDGSYDPQYNGVPDSDGKIRGADRPMSPTKEYPYVWNVERKATTSEFGEWKGDALNPGYAIFYNKYIGDPTYIELTNDLAVIPIEGDKIDPDFEEMIENQVLLYDRNKIVEDDDVQDGEGSDKSIDYYVIIGTDRYDITNSEKGVTINDETGLITINPKLLEGLKEITYGAIYNGTSFEKKMKIIFTHDAYEILPDQHVIRRTPYDKNDELSAYPIEKEVTGVIQKWDGKEWYYPDDQTIYAKFYHILDLDGDDSLRDGLEATIVNNGHYTFNIGDERGLEKIKIYFINKEGIEIFEEIGVIADGADGEKGSSAVTTRLTNPSAYRIRNFGKITNPSIETGVEVKIGTKNPDFTVAATNLPEDITIENHDFETGIITDPENITIKVSEDIEVGVYNIIFQIEVEVEGESEIYTETFTLTVVQNGENAKYYEIGPSSSIVKNPTTNPDPATIYPIVYAVDGNKTTKLDSIPENYKVTYTINNQTKDYKEELDASIVTSQLVFRLLDENGAEVDYCEVDPLSDGLGITTQLANPNVRVQVNNTGKFNGFPQENYLQIFNGTKDITSECIYVVEQNPFFNEIKVSEKEVNGVIVNVAAFTINEPEDENFERIPSIHSITIYISNSTLGFTLSEILTISIESQGGESPIIVDLDNSMVSVTATNGIVSEVSDITTSVHIHHGLQSIKEFTLEKCTGSYVDSSGETITIEGIDFEQDEHDVIIIKPNEFIGESLPLDGWMNDSNSKEFNFRLEFKFRDAEENDQTRHCILKLVKVSKAAKLVCFSSVFAENSSEIYLLATDGDGKGNLTSMLHLYATNDEEEVTTYEDDNRYRWKYTITEDDFQNEVINFKLKTDGGEVLDGEDIPLIHDGENGNNASFYKIGVNYGWVVKNSTGDVIVPSEDYIEPYIQLIDGYDKSLVNDWDQCNLSVKYSLDGQQEQDYVEPINPANVTNQIVFYLYENGEYLNEHIETDVVYQEKGEKGDPASGFSGTLPQVSTVLDGNDFVKDPVLYNVLSVYKNEELLQILTVEVAESGFYNDTGGFNIYDYSDPYKGHFSYAINSDVIEIFERSGQVCFYVEVRDSEGNDYYLYIPQQISIVKSGGENAVHLELTNDSEMIFTDSNGVPRGDVYAETTAILYDGSSEVKLDPDDIDVVWTGCKGSNPDGHTFSVEFIYEDVDVGYIDITATYKGINYTKRFTVTKSYGQVPYKIIFDKNVINTDTDTTLGISILRGGQPFTSELEGSGRYYLHINNDDGGSGYPSSSISGDGISLYVSELDVSGPIKVELYENDALLDSESVGIVKNGSDGSDYIIGDEDYKIIAEATAELVDGLYYSKENGEALAEAQTALNKAIYGNDPNPEEIVGLAAQVSALQANDEATTALKELFTADENGKYTNINKSALSQEDIAALTIAMYGVDGEEIMKNAGIDTDSMDFSNAVFAKFLAAGTGKFIEIDAENIDTTNLKVTHAESTTLGWKLEDTGDAEFANGNVKFSQDGSGKVGKFYNLKNNTEYSAIEGTNDNSVHIGNKMCFDKNDVIISNNTEDYTSNNYILFHDPTVIGDDSPHVDFGINGSLLTFGECNNYNLAVFDDMKSCPLDNTGMFIQTPSKRYSLVTDGFIKTKGLIRPVEIIEEDSYSAEMGYEYFIIPMDTCTISLPNISVENRGCYDGMMCIIHKQSDTKLTLNNGGDGDYVLVNLINNTGDQGNIGDLSGQTVVYCIKRGYTGYIWY